MRCEYYYIVNNTIIIVVQLTIVRKISFPISCKMMWSILFFSTTTNVLLDFSYGPEIEFNESSRINYYYKIKSLPIFELSKFNIIIYSNECYISLYMAGSLHHNCICSNNMRQLFVRVNSLYYICINMAIKQGVNNISRIYMCIKRVVWYNNISIHIECQ